MITPTNGQIITPSQSYDAYWVRKLHIDSPTLTTQATVTALLIPYNSTTGAIATGLDVNLYINDVINKSATDSNLANAMQTIFNELQRQGNQQGIL